MGGGGLESSAFGAWQTDHHIENEPPTGMHTTQINNNFVVYDWFSLVATKLYYTTRYYSDSLIKNQIVHYLGFLCLNYVNTQNLLG